MNSPTASLEHAIVEAPPLPPPASPPTTGVPEHRVTERKMQMAWQLFVSLEYQIQVADRKVQGVFGMNTLLVAALSLQNQHPLHALRTSGVTTTNVGIMLVSLSLLVCVCVTTWSAIMALRPRVQVKRRGVQPAESLFFFGSIQNCEESDFVDRFVDLSLAESAEQVLRQSHTVATILSAKYRWLNLAATSLLTSLLLWVSLQMIRFFS